MDKKILFLFVFIALFFFVFEIAYMKSGLNSDMTNKSFKKTTRLEKSKHESVESVTKSVKQNILLQNSVKSKSAQPVKDKNFLQNKEKGAPLKFVVEDGLAVVQGDLIVGALVDQNADPENLKNSYVVLPHIRLWPSSTIPFHIEADVPNPERIIQALTIFDSTVIRFIPYSNHKDAMVFINGSENCKSYVGYAGGLQPIMLSADCKTDDIAHEILHALGFIHEQNRSDRDNYINVIAENIDDEQIANFEKLPDGFMIVSGLSTFDFESLMIYPDWMFAKSGNSTMRTKTGQPIDPSKGLSRYDRERLDQAYRGR